MNYIIWNEVDSRTIAGLVICELPPIIKPKMRTQITEIEGKDGDFADSLGYASYDKTIKIALIDNYDVDAIAKYFTGFGQVIFSNEPTKYYRAEIIEQIDFERLLKFRTATIKFHTQPYKYLVDEEPANLEITNETELIVFNQGLENSKPEIMLWGMGIVQILVNGYGVFEIDLETGNVPITVDSELEDCYGLYVSDLKNRNMVGKFPILKSGKNVISWSGNLSSIAVFPNSRWL